MSKAQLYFLSDQYYLDFPDDKLMKNKYMIDGVPRFGTVLGRNTAFLIQNMCPATEKYLTAYIDKNNQPIRIDNRVVTDVVKNARNVLAMAKRGEKVIFPDVFKIYDSLNQQLLEM